MNVQRIIHDHYRAALERPFAWGQSGADCLHWAADIAVEMLNGYDPIASLRGRYYNQVSASRIMVEKGWKDMGDVAASMFTEIPPAMARNGDWAQVLNEDGTDLLGVVSGAAVAAKTPTGMGQIPRSRIKRAFRVEAPA